MTLKIVSSYNGVSDPDAAAYISAVEAADGELLEFAVGKAINDFVLGCKADGIWDAIKASCILAGARTLAGALVPLAGTAPTNNNFVAGDYNRETGLIGDGSTKYLDSSRNVNADPQNNAHQAVYVSVASATIGRAYIGAGATNTGSTQINTTTSPGATEFRSRTNGALLAFVGPTTGLIGQERSGPSSWNTRINQTTTARTTTSQTPFNGNILVFARGTTSAAVGLYSDARIAFYSIGESLDLAKLDGRVTDLITAFGAAIP